MRGDADSSMADTGAVQNRITRSCAVSFVVAFAMAYSLHRPARYAAGDGGGGFGGLGGGGFGGFGGSMGTTYSRLWPAWRRRQTVLHRPVALRYCGSDEKSCWLGWLDEDIKGLAVWSVGQPDPQ
jgi:hypothetical protein